MAETKRMTTDALKVPREFVPSRLGIKPSLLPKPA
jgi:hypothetical protein